MFSSQITEQNENLKEISLLTRTGPSQRNFTKYCRQRLKRDYKECIENPIPTISARPLKMYVLFRLQK